MEKPEDERNAAAAQPDSQPDHTGDAVLAQMEDKAQQQSSGSESEVKSAAPEPKNQPQQQQEQPQAQAQAPPEEKKPSKIKQLWEKTGLDA